MKREYLFIYSLSCPKTMEVRYIGSSMNPEKRLIGHMACHITNITSEWIKGLKNEGLKPILSVIDKEPAFSNKGKEQKWIEHYKETGANLLNRYLSVAQPPLPENHLALINCRIEPKLKTKIDKFKAKKHWTTSQTIRFILTDYFDAR